MAEPTSVFLGYRRSDTPYAAGRLADRLSDRFRLLMDIDIAPGRHFGRALTEAVEGCDVMVAACLMLRGVSVGPHSGRPGWPIWSARRRC